MGDVTALMMDVITEKSGHSVTPMAVSVCITPAAPSPLPIPYPVMASSVEGITDAAMRTRVNGSPWATVGSVLKTCHGNEPGTLKEVVSLNNTGPVFITMGAPTVYAELGMAGITGSLCMSNKQVTVGTNGSASGAGGGGGGGGGAGGGGPGASGPSGPQGPSNGGGGGGGSNAGAGGSSSSAAARSTGADPAPGTSSGPAEQHTCQGGHPVDLVTGAVVDQAVDLDLPGLVPLVFKRSYSSLRYRDRVASLGPGWAHEFEERISLDPRAIILRDKEGREVFFDRVEVGASTFHRRERLTLRRDGTYDFSVRDHVAKVTKVYRPLVAEGAAMLRSIRDGYDNAIELDYQDGRLARIRDTAGRDVVVRWRASHIVRLEVTVAGSVEQWVDYEYDDDGRLTSVIDALGHPETYEYDGFGRMTATTTRGGVRFGYVYDADTGRCVRTGGPKGLYALELDYDLANKRTFVHCEEPRIIEWDVLPGYARRTRLFDGTVLDESAWDPDAYRVAVANGAGEGTQHWYDARGNEVRRVDPTGRATTWEYDGDDNLVRRIDPDGGQTTFSHDHAGKLIGTRSSFGKFFVFARDERGRLLQVSDEGGLVRTYSHDAQHNIVAETDARGATTRFAFDALGRPVSKTDALGRVSGVSRDRLGRPTILRRADGTTLQRTFDSAGRVVRQVSPDGAVVELGWSGMGKLARLIDVDGRSWRLEYTSLERLKRVTNPSGATYTYRYDEAGRVVESTTFDERTTRFLRDLSGRVAAVERPDGARIAYEYDRGGLCLEERVAGGSTTSYRRDGAGRILEATLEENGQRHTTLLERDGLGRVVVERQGDRSLRYAYDLDGQLLERVLFDGTTTRYAYDRALDLASIEHAGRTFRFERDAYGRQTAVRDGRGAFSLTQRFDDLDRLLEQRVEGAVRADVPEVLAQRSYSYDRAGRVKRLDDAIWGTSSFAYDVAGRLASATFGDRHEIFHYDPAGSLLGALRGLDVARGRPPKWKLAVGNRLLETETKAYQYDKAGRRSFARDKRSGAVVDYVWDARDRLREVKLADGSRVVMSYDAFGRRIKKSHVAKDGTHRTTELLWHGDQICADLSIERGVRSFVHHPHRDTPLLQAERKEVFLVVTDHLGMPRELVDSAGRVAWAARHDAWGRIEDERWDPVGEQTRGYRVTSPFRLLGQYADDETGLTSTRFRFFDPDVGRWCSPDPLGLAGGVDLHGFDGAPTVHVDPLGLSATGIPHGSGSGTHTHGSGEAPRSGAEPNSLYTRTSSDGRVAVQNTAYDANGDAVGHVDFKSHGPGAPPGHGHTFPPGQPSSGHGPGATHIPPSDVPPDWSRLPAGIPPAQ